MGYLKLDVISDCLRVNGFNVCTNTCTRTIRVVQATVIKSASVLCQAAKDGRRVRLSLRTRTSDIKWTFTVHLRVGDTLGGDS